MLEDPPVGASLRVVELVYDDDVEGVGRDGADVVCGERLDACEHVLPSLGSGAPDIELTEASIGEDLAVGAQRLGEDLLAVGDEEKTGPLPAA